MPKVQRVLFSQHPLAQLAIAFASGILLANHFTPRTRVVLVLIAGLLMVTLLTCRMRRLQLSGMCLLLATVCAGSITFAIDTRHRGNRTLRSVLLKNLNAPDQHPVTLNGRLVSAP